jgi:hypothetical protein
VVRDAGPGVVVLTALGRLGDQHALDLGADDHPEPFESDEVQARPRDLTNAPGLKTRIGSTTSARKFDRER